MGRGERERERGRGERRGKEVGETYVKFTRAGPCRGCWCLSYFKLPVFIKNRDIFGGSKRMKE